MRGRYDLIKSTGRRYFRYRAMAAGAAHDMRLKSCSPALACKIKRSIAADAPCATPIFPCG
jgi:hypothetical protein